MLTKVNIYLQKKGQYVCSEGLSHNTGFVSYPHNIFLRAVEIFKVVETYTGNTIAVFRNVKDYPVKRGI